MTTCTDLDSFKKMPMSVIYPILKEAHWYHGLDQKVPQWSRDRVLNRFKSANPNLPCELAAELLDWGFNNPKELEIFVARRSPRSAAEMSVRRNRRLCEEAEKIVANKAKDKATLLDYCGKFGVILDDMSKITLKASFQDDSWREKKYIKKIEETKRQLKGFLTQMLSIGQIDPNQTVDELVKSL